jgi:RNA-directed DNA polymerase
MCLLGFSFTSKLDETCTRIHSKAIKRYENRVRELTDRSCGKSIHQIVYHLNQYLRGWWNYYRLTQSTSRFRSLHGWIVRRLRTILWKQRKNPPTGIRELGKQGISHRLAVSAVNARKGV